MASIRAIPDKDVSVIGLHTVFEHHEVMTPAVLKAFIHENKIRLGCKHASSRIYSLTMAATKYLARWTFVLIDQRQYTAKAFWSFIDLNVGMAVATLVAEARRRQREQHTHPLRLYRSMPNPKCRTSLY
jgi:hypothetical protein